MKIKDLKTDISLEGIKVRTSTGQVGYWKSQWSKGVWLNEKIGDTKVVPAFVESLEECLDWEVLN